jgi:subtilisin family serine protease
MVVAFQQGKVGMRKIKSVKTKSGGATARLNAPISVLTQAVCLTALTAASQMTLAQTTWTKVATEGQNYSVIGTQTIRFGGNNNWIEKTLTGGTLQCTNAFFGRDPLYGVVKACDAASSPVPPPPPSNGWKKVAVEGESYTLAGTQKVRYGAGNSWIEKVLSGTIQCTNTFFGADPIRGTVKSCEIDVSVTPPVTPPAVPPVHSTYPSGIWNYDQINLGNAIARSDQTKTVRLAIIDSGYNKHPDINWAKDAAGNIIKLTTDDNKANTDGLGVKHSLHVAGIAGAINYKNLGRVGACPQCEILSVKFAPPPGATDQQNDDHMGKAIRLAVDNGAQVINISIAAGGNPSRYPDGLRCTSTPLIQAAVDYAKLRNVAVIASAGNWGADDASVNRGLVKKNIADISPASCSGVISVGASDQTGSIVKEYSNHGGPVAVAGPSEGFSLTLVAPGGGRNNTDGLYGIGVDGVFGGATQSCDSSYLGNVTGNNPTSYNQIFSAWGSGSATERNEASCYRYLSGTSMSAPHVTGVVGLMLSVNPGLTAQQVKDILKSTAKNIDATAACSSQGIPNYCGSGLLNAYAAVEKAANTLPPPKEGPCSYAPSNAACKLDAIAYDTDTVNWTQETVIAYGKMWTYDKAGNVLQKAVDLRTIPRYANGPCLRAPAGEVCTIDSLTVFNTPEYGYIESITAYGYAYNFDKNGNPWVASNFDLKTIERYGNGGPAFGGSNPTPCGPAGQVQPCKFDTRELIDARNKWGVMVEGITAYGSYYIFTFDGVFKESRPLTSVARYAAGPCKYTPAGEKCTFDTSEKKYVNGQIIEVITAHGRYWEFADGSDTPLPGSGVDLKAMARFK